MKYYILLTFLSANLWAQVPAPKANDKPSKEETELYLEAIKEKQVSDQLLESEMLKACKDSADYKNESDEDKRKEVLRTCVADALESVDDKGMKELSEKLKLGSFDKEAAKSTKSIREYLNERLSESIYGVEKTKDGKLKALKDRKIADHQIYYQLYKEQIGKNTLLNVSAYCLENFGFEKPEYIVDVDFDKDAKTYSIKAYDILKVDPADANNYIINPSFENRDKNLTNAAIPAFTLGQFWANAAPSVNKIKEYEVCSQVKLADCPNPNNSRTVKMLEKLKLAEFKLGSTSAETKFIKDRYQFCASQVLGNMCEIYKCNNVYSDESSQENKEFCKDVFNINVTAHKTVEQEGLKSSDTTGQVACNVLQELRSYRNMIKATDEIQEGMQKDMKILTSLGQDIRSGSINDIYDGSSGGGKKKLDELTSISAKELTEKVDAVAGSAKEAEELRTKCMDGDKLKDGWEEEELCQKLKASTTGDTITKIEEETEAQAVAFMKQVSDLTSKDELTKFMQENGLADLMNQEGFNDLDEAGIKLKLEEHYKAEKKSQLAAIKDRFLEEAKLKAEPADATEEAANKQVQDSIAKETIADVEQHKKRLETLFQYSNVVSSYLSVEDEKGNELGSNSIGRQLETDNVLEDESKDLITGYYGEGTSSSSSKGGVQSMNYIQVLDHILGDAPSAEEKK